MEKGKHGEKVTPSSITASVRGEEAASQPGVDKGGDRWTGQISGNTGNDAIGTSREIGEESAIRFILSLNGGILSQLIKQAEDQLENAIACIAWYEDERVKAEKRLAELQQLQSAQNQGVIEE